ncbi:unnamed protein product [Gongylonema pulchrum]|uniref:Uncharacterized protein n=1 Tax=Gongylonema pulchrum TaxID=637853 RepID=A0A3P7RM29_9BILA|nr:unnamed protein product [Gongylonema pulchrum]VDN44402.1 unnamed protein product [Gongylonema pulchrum]
MVTMLYAAIGIPLLLLILHKLGRQSLRALESFWEHLLRQFI